MEYTGPSLSHLVTEYHTEPCLLRGFTGLSSRHFLTVISQSLKSEPLAVAPSSNWINRPDSLEGELRVSYQDKGEADEVITENFFTLKRSCEREERCVNNFLITVTHLGPDQPRIVKQLIKRHPSDIGTYLYWGANIHCRHILNRHY